MPIFIGLDHSFSKPVALKISYPPRLAQPREEKYKVPSSTLKKGVISLPTELTSLPRLTGMAKSDTLPAMGRTVYQISKPPTLPCILLEKKRYSRPSRWKTNGCVVFLPAALTKSGSRSGADQPDSVREITYISQRVSSPCQGVSSLQIVK